MQPEEQRTANCSCGRVCTYSPVQKLAQLQLSVNEQSLRAKGVGKKGKVVEKTRVTGSSKSKVALFFFFISMSIFMTHISLLDLSEKCPIYKEGKKINLTASRKLQIFSQKRKKFDILWFWDFDVRININRKISIINYTYLLF